MAVFFTTKDELVSYVETRLFGKNDSDTDTLWRCVDNLFRLGWAEQVSNGFTLNLGCGDFWNFC